VHVRLFPLQLNATTFSTTSVTSSVPTGSTRRRRSSSFLLSCSRLAGLVASRYTLACPQATSQDQCLHLRYETLPRLGLLLLYGLLFIPLPVISANDTPSRQALANRIPNPPVEVRAVRSKEVPKSSELMSLAAWLVQNAKRASKMELQKIECRVLQALLAYVASELGRLVRAVVRVEGRITRMCVDPTTLAVRY
jgi:hypothetical protein